MAKTIRYQRIHEMKPRDGVKYSTKYLKQLPSQREELVKHVHRVVEEIVALMETDRQANDYIMDVQQRQFPKSNGERRTIFEIITDMLDQANGKMRGGHPKDFALAPIERWNRLFKGTEYEIALVQTHGASHNTFHDIMSIDYDGQ